MAGTIICPDCGRVAEYGKRKRERCPDCQRKRNNRQNSESFKKLFKENSEFRLAMKQDKKEADEFGRERAKRDAEIDARSREYIKKQCRVCKYQLRQGAKNQKRCIGCDYIAWKGHSADKGNGPGDCRSFEPETKETHAERKARRDNAFRVIEANNAQNTGEKMRDVNQL